MSLWTRKAIMEVFNGLLGEKPLDRITVKDITERGSITRNTFYYHFADIYDLAVKFLEDRLDHLSSQLQDKESEDAWEELLMIIARQIKTDNRKILHLFRSSKSQEIPRFIHRATKMTLEKFFDSIPGSNGISTEKREMIIDFYRCALEGVVGGWISQDAPQNPEVMMHHLSNLLKSGMRHAIEDATNCS